MATPHLRRRIVVGAGLIAAAIYFICYVALPDDWQDGGFRVNHVRRFYKDWQVRLFAPAGWAEGRVIRLRNLFQRHIQCGEAIVLRGNSISLSLQATPDISRLDALLDRDADILKFAAQHPPLGIVVHNTITTEGVTTDCLYSDCGIDRAENALKTVFPPPYTLAKVIRWYESTADEKTRAHLITILAASRDPRAAIVLAAAIHSPSMSVRLAALDGIIIQFGAGLCSGGGGIEQDFAHAFDWLEENMPRLINEAKNHPFD